MNLDLDNEDDDEPMTLSESEYTLLFRKWNFLLGTVNFIKLVINIEIFCRKGPWFLGPGISGKITLLPWLSINTRNFEIIF